MTVRRALLITLSQSYVTLGLQFIASVIIARLLTPEEIGVFSVAMVLTAIANTLRDFGVVEYVVQERELNVKRLRSASLFTLLTAWSMAFVVLILAQPAAAFYRKPDVELLLSILSLNFFLLPFGSVVSAHMRRQMEFTRIALIRLASSAVHAVTSVVMAYLGFGYFSLAWSMVLASLTHVILVLAYRPEGFPMLPGLGELRRVFSFGSFSSLNQLLKDQDKGAPDLVLGRLMGMDAVAYFGRASGLIDLFNRLIMQAVETVALPLLSERGRNKEGMTDPFLTSVTYLTGIAWPFYLFVALAADPIIRVLYGNQWDAAIPVVRWLCLGEALTVPFYLQHQVAISLGRVRREALRSGLILAIKLLPLLFLPTLGLEAVAAGYACSYVAVSIINYLFLRTYCDIGLGRLWHAIRPSLLLSAITAAPLALVAFGPTSRNLESWQNLGISVATLGLAWLSATRLVAHPWLGDLRQLFAGLGHVIRRGRKQDG